MFIRRTQTRNRLSGEPYVTHRLVHSARVGHVIKQSTLLNLGSHLDLPQAHWPALAKRIDELLHGQCSMPDASLPEQAQVLAQRFAAQIIARTPNLDLPCTALPDAPAAALPASKSPTETGAVDRYQEVDLESLELVNPRSVGVGARCAVGDAPMRL
ncbi:hypothetical protein [Verminephrobacter aporrectodeae]|uniref:hypothetical protein n=1 Tax=Verminephrobacter aporrectodeae TaxID=1110389 RepID=UPI00223805AD|nr:hypothetical protein [Verminephrobacter aporrectodeae]